MPSVISNLAEALGPIVITPCENLYGLGSEVTLDAIAIELDFVEPTAAAGTFSTEVASAGSMNPG